MLKIIIRYLRNIYQSKRNTENYIKSLTEYIQKNKTENCILLGMIIFILICYSRLSLELSTLQFGCLSICNSCLCLETMKDNLHSKKKKKNLMFHFKFILLKFLPQWSGSRGCTRDHVNHSWQWRPLLNYGRERDSSQKTRRQRVGNAYGWRDVSRTEETVNGNRMDINIYITDELIDGNICVYIYIDI